MMRRIQIRLASVFLLAACSQGEPSIGNAFASEACASPFDASAKPNAEERTAWVESLFTGVEQYENFVRLPEVFPRTVMKAAPVANPFPKGEPFELPETLQVGEHSLPVQNHLVNDDTGALLVLHKGKIVYENYWLSGGPCVPWLSMSVAKSFVSTGIGFAVADGKIDIEKPVTDYVPELAGSAYDGVRIKDILEMTSGAAWNEDYSDPSSEVHRIRQVMATGRSMDALAASIEGDLPPGTVLRYNSMDTHVLGMLLTRATGETVAGYLERKLWQPLGMESNAYWLQDDHGAELVNFALNATARDYAKLGELFRLKGRWNGKQILPETWVTDATTADAPHLQPGQSDKAPFGYGYQWWIPPSGDGTFIAAGIYHQTIYINPAKETVIVKLSAYSGFGVTPAAQPDPMLLNFILFDTIAAHLAARSD